MVSQLLEIKLVMDEISAMEDRIGPVAAEKEQRYALY
tara:strand:+ start:11434 stop:11544 length:111 start_codon:yes stop_codon:yes gene_type:complete